MSLSSWWLSNKVVVYTFLALILVSKLHAVTNSSVCFDNNALCFSGTVNSANDTAIFTVNTTVFPRGWVAIGIGAGMSSANIWHMYFNNSGSVFRLVDRLASGYRSPAMLSNSSLKLLKAPELVGNTTYVIQFSRPLSANGFNLTYSDQNFLWGIKYNFTPTDALFGKHTSRGLFTYNVFTSFPSQNIPLVDMSTAFTWHKYCMGFAWNFSAGFGILIARFAKPVLPNWWFRTHVFLFAATLVLTIVGFTLMVLAHPSPHFSTPHGILGLTVVVGMVVQFLLGIVINQLFQRHRRTTPLRDRMHWYLGYLVYVLAMANVLVGLNFVSEPLIVFSAVVYAGFLIVFVVAQLRWGQSHDTKSLKMSQPVLCI